MLTLKQLRENKAEAVRRLAKKGVDAEPIITLIEALDDKRKALQVELDNCLAEQNQAAKQIGALMGKGDKEAAEAKKREVGELKNNDRSQRGEERCLSYF